MNQDLKNNFSQAATMLTKLFNSANQQYREAYAKGQKDLINDIVQFCLSENNNLKTIELSKLEVFLQQKLESIQERQNQQQKIIDQIGRQSNASVQNSLNNLGQQQQQQQMNNYQNLSNNINNSMNMFQQNNQIGQSPNQVQSNNYHNNQSHPRNSTSNTMQELSIQHYNQINNQNMQYNQQQPHLQNFENQNQIASNQQQSSGMQNNVNNQIENNNNANPQNRRILQIKGYKVQGPNTNNHSNQMSEEPNS